MRVFLTCEWDLIFHGSGGTSTSAPGATLAACWLYELWPISGQWIQMEMGFTLRAGRCRPGV